jgi:sulfide:quinone oxidoreductase
VTNVVILGGGFGGVAAAVSLAGTQRPHSVTLVDRHETNYLAGDNPFVVVGARERHQVSRRLRDLARYGVHFIEAEIDRIEPAEKVVRTSSGVLNFDYLVIALGAVYEWDAVPGSHEAYSFYELEQAERLHDRLRDFDRGSIVLGVAAMPIKCPPAPFEMMLMIDWWLRERGLRNAAELHVAFPGPAPLAVAGPAPSEAMAAELDHRGIVVHPGAGVVEVDAGSMLLADGTELHTDVGITVPKHRPPAVVSGSLDGGQWVRVDRATLETSIPNVFAIGDVNVIPLGGAALPKAGVFAAGQGRTVGAVIAARIDGTEPPPPYDGVGHCFIAFSGDKGAQIGGAFFAPGRPDVTLDVPGVDGMRGKERFDDRWKSFQI